MKKYITLIVLLTWCIPAFGAIQLTDEEFQLLGAYSQKVKQEFPDFKGFNGTQDAMVVLGGTNEIDVKNYMDALDPNDVKNNDKWRKARKQVRNKLKALGLDNKDLENMNLDNDIGD